MKAMLVLIETGLLTFIMDSDIKILLAYIKH